MTDEQITALVTECKIGLGMQEDETAFDGVILQKVKTVLSFLRRAGVSEETLESEDAVGVIVMGVGDIWNQEAGSVKFSPAYISMASQLTYDGITLTVTSNPADGAVGVAVDVSLVLTFNKMVSAYMVSLLEYESQDSVATVQSLDVTKKKLTITPSSNLSAATKYAIVIESATASTGPTLDYTVISFTTA